MKGFDDGHTDGRTTLVVMLLSRLKTLEGDKFNLNAFKYYILIQAKAEATN